MHCGTSGAPDWYQEAFPSVPADTPEERARIQVLELIGWAYGPDAQLHVTRLLARQLAGEEIG